MSDSTGPIGPIAAVVTALRLPGEKLTDLGKQATNWRTGDKAGFDKFATECAAHLGRELEVKV